MDREQGEKTRADRKLGDEWEDWSGSLDESASYEETAALFTLFAALALVIVLVILGFVLYMIEPRLALVNPALVWAARMAAVFLALGSAVLGVALITGVFTGKSVLRRGFGQTAASRILPLALAVARRLGIPRDRLANSFVRFSNAIVRSSHHPGPGKVIILIPRCLTSELKKSVQEMGARAGVGVFTATGGGEARMVIRRERPSGVIGVACERDLISGISDIAPMIATIGVVNKRPEGPCKNTLIDLDELRTAIETLTGPAMKTGRTAIGMFSGGLDSILAARIMVLEGLDVIALHFYTGFSDTLDRELSRGFRGKWEPPPDVASAAADVGARLLPMDVSGQEYHDLITHPGHGYGSAANPCLDCRAWLLGKAREVMESEGADFVFTGEVLGQRPMSQQRPHLRFMEKRSGLFGRLLRPLSALLLEPTVPEIEGTVDRGHLYGFHGRSRHPQQELAAKLGIETYPSSGGGCLLADPIFGRKFHELLAHTGGGSTSRLECESLKAGRHIRLPGGLKAVTGRTESENNWLGELFGDEAWMFDARDHSGATVFVHGEPDGESFRLAAAIAARYSKGKDCAEVTVVARRGPLVREYIVRPASPEEIAPLIVT